MRSSLLLPIVGITFALIALEGVLRLADVASPSKTTALRYHWSEDYFHTHQDGTVTLKANLAIREQAVIGNTKEFDVHYKSNSWGLIDHRENFKTEKLLQRIAIVGDSYTAGTGAQPWLPVLRERIEKDSPHTQLYNLGLIGAGFQHFEKRLLYYDKITNFTDVIIIAIDDDWGRMLWYPISAGNNLWFCKPSETIATCTDRPAYLTLQKDSPPLKNKLAPKEQTPPKQSSPPRMKQLLRFLIAHSKLLDSLNFLRHRLLVYTKEVYADHPAHYFKDNFAALERIVRHFPKGALTLVQIPSRAEVAQGSYHHAMKHLLDAVDVRFVDLWEQCDFHLSDYHKHDQHFTAKGYQKLSHCFQENVLSQVIHKEMSQ